MLGMSQQDQTMDEDTTVLNQNTASNADAAAPHEQSSVANDDSSKADAPILKNLDEIPAANDADAAPKADTEKPKKSWTRFFGGLAYDEVKNAIGWLGTLSAVSAAWYVFSKIAIPVSITAIQAFNPALIIPGELIKMFFTEETLIGSIVISKALEGTNKAIPDAGFKAGKEWAKDALRKRFGIDKNGIDNKNRPTGFIARHISEVAYFQIADKTSDVLALGAGFLNTIKSVGIMYILMQVLLRIVTGRPLFALPSADAVVQTVKEVAVLSAGITIGKQAVQAISGYGYNFATGATDVMYDAAASAYDSAANSRPVSFVYNNLPNNPVTFVRKLYNGPTNNGGPVLSAELQKDTQADKASFGSKVYAALWQ